MNKFGIAFAIGFLIMKYFETPQVIELAAERVGLNPANLIPASASPAWH